MHIKDWDSCFKNILNSCKKGASILIEESGFPFVCLPEENELFKRANFLVNELANRAGLNYNCFPLLWKFIQNLDVEIANVEFNLPALTTERQKSFQWHSCLFLIFFLLCDYTKELLSSLKLNFHFLL